MLSSRVHRRHPGSLIAVAAGLVAWSVSWYSTAASIAQSDDGFRRPWGSRPYQVLVWICGSTSPEIESSVPRMAHEVMRRAELIDPSAWNIRVEPAPLDWRQRLLRFMDQDADDLEGLAEAEPLSGFDKLIPICLTEHRGMIRYRIREFDIQTGQWGAVLDRASPQGRDLTRLLYYGIERVFMPLARIDRVAENGDVFVRARAVNSCVLGDPWDGTVEAIENSPVWIRPEDRFLPIIRRVDRNGNLAQLEPIPFTFLTVKDQSGSRLVCELHSRQRAALGGRSSKRAQKLALVIRPPESSTQLKLISRDAEQRPLSGYEIYSRDPGDTREESSEFLGLTDWRGTIDIPPSNQGLRLIYVKRGARALMKVPLIPGLYRQVVTKVPDDEARLNAEGVAQGFQIEILNLVAQRELFAAQICSALDNDQLPEARSMFQQLQRLESPQDLKIRLANEESRLRNSTQNKRELDRIASMFQQLRTLVNENITGSVESDLQAAIQDARASGSAR